MNIARILNNIRSINKLIVTALYFLVGLLVQEQNSSVFWLGAAISGTTEMEARGQRLYHTAG